MPSLRTALVLTLTAAAAAVVPAGAAAAAPAGSGGPLPVLGAADALPAGGLTDDALPLRTIAEAPPVQAVTGALHDGVAGAIGPAKHLTLDPLSNTGIDPLDNAVVSQVADFPAVSTAMVTGPITRGGSLATLPVVGTAVGLLPG